MFESLHGNVREIDPITGEEIELRPIPRNLCLRHFILHFKTDDKGLNNLKSKILNDGFNSLSENDLDYIQSKRVKRFMGV